MKSELTSSSGVRLILVPPGSFIMGSPPNEVGRAYFEREREVTLSHEFYLGMAPYAGNPFLYIARTSLARFTCSGVASMMVGLPGGDSFFFRG